jgi:hypothetical protein
VRWFPWRRHERNREPRSSVKRIFAILSAGLLVWAVLIYLRPKFSPTVRPIAINDPFTFDEGAPEAQSNRQPAPPVRTQPVPTFRLELGTCPASIKPIIDTSHNFLHRQTLVRSLLQHSLSTEEAPKDLSRPEVEALLGFLLEKHPEDDTQRGHVLKSDLMDALCAQPNLQPDLTKVLAELYHDHDQNVVIRDYAVQHLALLDERLTEGVSWSSSEIETQRQLIETLLWEASGESDSSIGGTALLALMRSLKTNDQPSQERLASTALRLANNPAISPLARISAIQVCAQIQVHAALPHLCRTAEQDPNFTVRISAIGALGQIGNANTVEVLKKIAREQNPRLDAAVTVALARLGPRSP